MYDDWIVEREDGSGLALASPDDPALVHQGDYGRLLDMHRRHVHQAHALRGVQGVRVLDPTLFKRVADNRTLRSACDHLLRRGGKAVGPNGLRLHDLESPEIWSLCRALSHGIRDHTYRPGESRTVRIPKPGKPGKFRTLTIQNAEDRVVARAAVEVLLPITELLASPFSFGFRPRRNRMNALATAVALARHEDRWVWVKADVEKAFDRIPFERLMSVFASYFPNDVVELLRVISHAGRKRGIRQGSPLSPMLFNVYADSTLTWPFRQRRPDDVVVRFADDILLPYGTAAEAQQGYNVLSSLATSASIGLKGAPDDVIRDIRANQELTWLGYLLRREDNRLAIRIGEPAWTQLQFRLAEAHLVPESPLRAIGVIRGWIGQMGPCYPCEDQAGTAERIRAIAAELSFDEIPSAQSLIRDWQLGLRNWERSFVRESDLLASRLIAYRA
jgi:Reverse transcriptase (RNA-dependent DNA polymerase)